jgi:Antitoxin Phd_YefM, type II toxin-antitoxin system
MKQNWLFEEAKANFLELVQQAAAGKVQIIVCEDQQQVVMLDAASYQRLIKRDQSTLLALMGDPIDDEALDVINTRNY